jgi:hypothetical protein
MFLSHLCGGMDEPEMKIVDVFICKLRKKLASASGGKDYIETIWGRGYVVGECRKRTVAGQTRQAEVTGLDTGRCPLWLISGHGAVKSEHGVAPSEQTSFAVAAMTSGRGPGEDRVRPRCVPRPKFRSLGVRVILFDLGETQSRRSRPGSLSTLAGRGAPP